MNTRVSLISLSVLLSPSPLFASFQVLNWSLKTNVQISGGSQDIDRHQVVTNPWQFTSISQMGTNISRADYDFSWLTDGTLGNFNTDLVQTIRTPGVTTIFDSYIDIFAASDLLVSVDFAINYQHTPGDLSDILGAVVIRNLSLPFGQQNVYNEGRRGGNLSFQPSSGTLSIHREDVLPAGVPYRLIFTTSCDNISDASQPPTGTIDVAGHINFAITAVPEPSTSLLAMFGLLMATCARRQRR